jgi:uncharacterized membrane protein
MIATLNRSIAIQRYRVRLATIPAWAWLLLVAVPLRFINLGSESFWYDETFTAWITKLPFDRMFTAIQGDVHPPLFYVIEWVIAHTLGSSEYALRLPSAILGTVAVILLWRVALAIGFEPRTAFVAGLIAAVLPGALYYSQEARMYALLLCALLGALLSAILGRWRWYAICSIIAVYSQNLGLVSIAALNLGVLIIEIKIHWQLRRFFTLMDFIKLRRIQLREAIIAMALVVIAWAPWGFVEMKQAAAMGQSFWLEPLSLSATIQPLIKLSMGERAAPSIAFMAYLAAIALTAVGLWVSRRWLNTQPGALVLSLMLGAPVVLALASWLWRSVYLPRAMIGSVYLVSLLWAWLLCHLDNSDRRVVRLILVPMLGATLIAHYYPNQTTRPPWRDNVGVIKSGWQAGDVVYYGSINAAIAVGYYMQGYPYALRHTLGDLNQSLSPETQTAMGFNESSFDTLAADGYTRAWLIVGINPLSNIDEINEIHRILATYSNTIARTFTKTKLGEEAIYLVTLPTANYEGFH